jgi:hypothetical protein
MWVYVFIYLHNEARVAENIALQVHSCESLCHAIVSEYHVGRACGIVYVLIVYVCIVYVCICVL